MTPTLSAPVAPAPQPGAASNDQAEAATAGAPRPSASSTRTLFRIPFRSAMDDEDAHRLRGAMGVTLHLHPKHPAVVPPLGVARLDFHSGLFLVRGEDEREWALECRTWGDPAAEVVRGWRLEAILAARRLDASVPHPMPPRASPPAPERRHARRRRTARGRSAEAGGQ